MVADTLIVEVVAQVYMWGQRNWKLVTASLSYDQIDPKLTVNFTEL